MATLNEILEFEQRREAVSDWRRIYLHKDGKFYRAYQVSAWLYSCAINEYKVTHRRFKSVPESVLFVGFPVESLLKWVPETVVMNSDDEQLILLELPEEMLSSICGEQEPRQAYEEWKVLHPLSEEKQSANVKEARSGTKSSEPRRPQPAIFSLMQRILGFPIESKSPIECMLFLAEIRKSLAEHF